jgi:hypothetical protein
MPLTTSADCAFDSHVFHASIIVSTWVAMADFEFRGDVTVVESCCQPFELPTFEIAHF